jgi:hypothetical protein
MTDRAQMRTGIDLRELAACPSWAIATERKARSIRLIRAGLADQAPIRLGTNHQSRRIDSIL